MPANAAPSPASANAGDGAITMDAPWKWLAAGWRDFLQAPALSFGYGIAAVGGGVFILYTLWRLGLSALIPVAFGVFALVGPIIAVGLYEISRRLQNGEPLDLGAILLVRTKSPMQIAYIGFLLMFAVLVWVRLAIIIYALFASASYAPLGDFLGFAFSSPAGLAMLIVGTMVGGLVAFSIYLMTVVSIPMLMDRRADIFSGIFAGVKAVRDNPAPMLLWAWLIGILVLAGVATLFVGLAVAFPVLGHATWHAYQDIMKSEAATA